MAEIDPIVLQLKVENAQFRRDLQSTTLLVSSALGRQEQSVRNLERQMKASSVQIGSSLKGLAGSLASYFTGRELIGLQDAFIRLQNNLRVTGLEGDALKAVQDRLFASAQKYGVELEGLSKLFSAVSQASKELGASQDEVFGITEAVSAALKVTGISAGEAQGALLQLGQALRGGTVQAEEYNSLLDGLYPLLEAAANGSDRFGGSVANLTKAVKAGKVSSSEFFAAILAGADTLENKAAKATLTTSAGLTTLSNALTVYFGEADKANGVSAALGEALGSLADNLDTIIPALSAVGAAIGVQYVAGMISATAATEGATVSAIALRAALSALQTVAIAAVIAGLAYMVTNIISAESSLDSLGKSVSDAEASLAKAESRARAAGVNIEKAGDSSKAATGNVTGLGNAFAFAAEQALKLANNAKLAAISTASQRKADASKQIDQLQRVRTPRLTAAVLGKDDPYIKAREQKVDALIAGQQRIISSADSEIKILSATPDSAFEKGGGGQKPTTVAGKPRKPRGASGPSADDIEQQYSRDLRTIVARDLSARLSMATNADTRAELENRLLNDEIRNAEDEISNNKNYSAAQKAKLRVELKAQEASERAQIERDRQEQSARDAAGIAEGLNRNQRDLLEADSRLIDTREGRRDLELRLLDLAYEQERADLEAVVASKTATDAQKKIAEARLAILGQLQASDKEGINRDNQSPLEAYRRNISETGKGINDAYETVAVNGLEKLNNGLTDAIVNSKNLGDTFKNIAKSIISDLIRIAIQQTIVNSLAGAIGGIFGAGGIAGAIGFSSGGYTGDGPKNKVAGVVHKGEYVVPASAVNRLGVSNLEAMANGRAASSMSGVSATSPQRTTVIKQTIQVDARNSVNPEGFAQQILAISNQQAQQAAATMGKGVMKAMPQRLQQFQTDGT